MRHLINSDSVFDHFLGQAAATDLLGRLDEAGGIAIGVVTSIKLYEGLMRSLAGGDLRAQIDDFLAGRPVLLFTPAIARRCAHLRDALRPKGQRVRSRHLDLVNAATAVHHDLTSVTRSTAVDNDVPGIRLHA